MAGPTIEIQPPVRTDREGGIRDVATFRSNDRLAVAEAVVFQSDGCTFPDTEELRCIAATPPADKTYDGITIDDGIDAPFTMFAGVACVAGPDPDEKERARRIFDSGQDRELENQLEAWATGGTALTNGGSVIGAIKRVEQAIDDQYIARGNILMSRADALEAAAGGAIEITDGVLKTKLGTPVIASGRVALGTVYGLGAIVVEHTEVLEREVLDPTTNTQYALAEAVFVIAVDCEYRVKSSTAA
jgi:hypothetical protein